MRFLKTMTSGRVRKTCRDCGTPVDDPSVLSLRGLCVECGPRRQREACLQMHEHDGPWFRYWRRRSAAGLGATLPGEELIPGGRFRPAILDDDGYPA